MLSPWPLTIWRSKPVVNSARRRGDVVWKAKEAEVSKRCAPAALLARPVEQEMEYLVLAQPALVPRLAEVLFAVLAPHYLTQPGPPELSTTMCRKAEKQ
jgi:hypothetical protein